MKYMNFTRSCSYTCLAYMLENYNLDYDDIDIAKEMKLSKLFFYDESDETYLSGPMLQGKSWFDVFLSQHDLEFHEIKLTKSTAIAYLKNTSSKIMLGLNLTNGKHALVFEFYKNDMFKFMNPHYKNDNENDYYVYSSSQLIDLLDEVTILGYIKKLENDSYNPEYLFKNSISYLRKYKNDFLNLINLSITKVHLFELKETFFASLLLTLLPILPENFRKNIETKVLRLQSDFLKMFKSSTNKFQISNYINTTDYIYLIDCLEQHMNE